MTEIFEAIEMEKEIASIFISDQTGKLMYSTNGKFKNEYIINVLPEFPNNEKGLNWIAKDGQIITQIPIYATAGKNWNRIHYYN